MKNENAEQFDGGSVRTLRLLRLLRVVKLLNSFPALRSVSTALLLSFSNVGYVMLMIILVNFILAVMGVLLFAENDPQVTVVVVRWSRSERRRPVVSSQSTASADRTSPVVAARILSARAHFELLFARRRVARFSCGVDRLLTYMSRVVAIAVAAAAVFLAAQHFGHMLNSWMSVWMMETLDSWQAVLYSSMFGCDEYSTGGRCPGPASLGWRGHDRRAAAPSARRALRRDGYDARSRARARSRAPTGRTAHALTKPVSARAATRRDAPFL